MSYWLLAFPLALSIAQFLSDRINIERSRYRHEIASFAAAIAITYLILVFLPEVYSKGAIGAIIPIVAGFTLIHLLEKLIYKKFPGRFSLHRLKTYHDELHAAILVLYHFGIGLVLVDILETDMGSGLLFMPPLLLFATIGNWSVHHHYVTQNHLLRLVLASSTTVGAVLGFAFSYPDSIRAILLSFIAGIMLFVVVRESLPKEKEGNPALFLLGVALYTAVIAVTTAL